VDAAVEKISASPERFPLVCTKTTASYEAACKIHERDLNNLARIVAIEKKLA
jgi:hypothetical protein